MNELTREEKIKALKNTVRYIKKTVWVDDSSNYVISVLESELKRLESDGE